MDDVSSKYPRTFHLPWSPGGTSDDKRLTREEIATQFLVPGAEYVITEKMDGSNLALTRTAVYARSHSGAPGHRSFDGAKSLHAQVGHLIDLGTTVFGEWLYAKHSIEYTNLPSYFLLFGVRDDRTQSWLSWEDCEFMAEFLGVPTVPVLWRGTSLRNVDDLESMTMWLYAKAGACGAEREGVVVRHTAAFWDPEFRIRVAKLVRRDHVQTDTHWKDQEIVRNGLRGSP